MSQAATWNEFPDEIWIKILHYVKFADRSNHVQFVNKRFHSLCRDQMLNKHIDFSSAIFMSEKSCLKVIHETNDFVKDLCFRDSHWFSRTMFLEFPMLPSLVSIDIVGINIGCDLLKLMTKTPSLKRLAFSTNFDDMYEMYEMVEKTNYPSMHLKSLHITMIGGDTQDWDFSDFIMKYFLSDEYPELFSFGGSWCMCEGIPSLLHSTLALNTDDSRLANLQHDFSEDEEEDEYDGEFDMSSVCDLYSYVKLHKPTRKRSGILSTPPPVFELSTLRYLSIPVCANYSKNCHLSLVPTSLPNLEYLSINLQTLSQKRDGCFKDMVNAILFECEYPKLKCVNVSGPRLHEFTNEDIDVLRPVMKNFLEKISALENLDEINLLYLPVNLRMGLELNSFSKNLKALAICYESLFKEIKCTSEPGSSKKTKKLGFLKKTAKKQTNVDEQVLHDLAIHCPRLQKLEINSLFDCKLRMPGDVLRPISQFKELQSLSLTDINDSDLSYLSLIMTDCTQLTSLALCSLGSERHCDFQDILEKQLHCLTQLQKLRVEHSKLKISQALINSICLCSTLRKLSLVTNEEMTSKLALESVTSLLTKCKNLNMISIPALGTSESTQNKIDKIIGRPEFASRKPLIKCNNEYEHDGENWLIEDFSLESDLNVATYTAYDFLYYY